MSLNFTPRTWTAGEIPTAALFNSEFRDALSGIQAAYTAFTPTWTASTTNPTLGNGTISMRYQRIGHKVDCDFYLALGSTTNIGSGAYSFSLPVTALNSPSANIARQTFWFRDASASADFQGFGILTTTTTLQIRGLSANALASSTTPVVPANGDWISGSFTYEAA